MDALRSMEILVNLQSDHLRLCEPSGLLQSEDLRPLPSLWVARDFADTGKNLPSQQSVFRPTA